MPVVIVVVMAVGMFMVQRVRGYFGHDSFGTGGDVFEDTKPFHPKVVLYEIFSPNGTTADINYLDLGAVPQRVDDAALPWSLELSTTDPAVSPNIVAQGHSDTLGCRITIDGELKAERISHEMNAYTFCFVKSA